MSTLHKPDAYIEVPGGPDRFLAGPRIRPDRRAAAAGPDHGDPGPKARAHVKFDEEWTSPSLPRAYPIVPVRGQGMALEDIDGNLFLDFAAGIAVNSTGHGHPRVIGAIKEQARSSSTTRRPTSTCRSTPRPPRELAAHRADRAARLRTYLGNSGHRVVEASMKLARHFTGRPYIVGFLGGFHGRTYGVGDADRIEGQVPRPVQPAPARRVPRPVRPGRGPQLVRRRAVQQPRPGRTRSPAIVVEPIQGEGGYIVPEDGFLEGLRELCDEARHPARSPTRSSRAPAGPGRCGRSSTGASSRTSCSSPRASPRACRSARWSPAPRSWSPGAIGAHGSTYGGNPVACAAALATIELLEGGLVDNAAERGEQAHGRAARAAGSAIRGTVHRRPGQGPDARRRVRRRRSSPRPSSGPASSAACSSSSAASRPSGCARPSSPPRRTSRRRCGSSARPWQMSRRTQQTWRARPQRPARCTTARSTASAAIAQHAALLEAQVGRPVPDTVR